MTSVDSTSESARSRPGFTFARRDRAHGAARNDITRGAAAMIVGVGFFALHDMVGKLVVESYPVAQMLALRSGIALLILLVITLRRGSLPPLPRATVPAHLVRLVAMLGAIFLFFSALETLPLADATAIAFGAPFVMLLLSRPLLGEHVPRGAWGAVFVGFIGVLVIVRPGGDVKPAALLAVGASILYAIGMLTTRRLARTELVFSMVFWVIAGQFVIALATLPFVWRPVEPRHWPLLAALAVLNLLGQLGLVRAFSLAPASAIAPYEYTALLWAAALGFLVFGDVPSASLWIGAVIIIGAGSYVTLRTRPTQVAAPLPGQSE
jgi:drug/metabolite transporter (DMT)-like permease